MLIIPACIGKGITIQVKGNILTQKNGAAVAGNIPGQHVACSGLPIAAWLLNRYYAIGKILMFH